MADPARVMKKWMSRGRIPGAAAAIIKDNDIHVCKALGFRDMEHRLPVTTETRFLIGSLSKAFTALACLLLVDDGKLDLNEPIRNYLPEFCLLDPRAAERVTLIDFLSHRSGLPAHDALWLYNSSLSRIGLLQKMAYLELSCLPGQQWQYCNLGYVLAGGIIEYVTGYSWETFVQQHILYPLQISGSFRLPPDPAQNNAWPYQYSGHSWEPLPYSKCSAMGPAGTSLQLSITELARWMQFHLGSGSVTNSLPIGLNLLLEMYVPRAIIPANYLDAAKLRKNRTYGLGWFCEEFQGLQHIYHSGGYPGFTSYLSLYPEHKLGIAVLSNAASNFAEVLALSLAEEILNLKKLHSYPDIFVVPTGSLEPGILHPQYRPGRPPPRPLTQYCGEYTHPAYGKVVIKLTDDQLILDYNHRHLFLLEHVDQNRFTAISNDIGPIYFLGLVSFSSVSSSVISEVHIPFEPAVEAIRFVRQSGSTHTHWLE